FPIIVSIFGARALARQTRSGATLLTVLSLSNLALYFSSSFWVVRHLWTASSSRFLLPTLTAAMIASVAWCRPYSRAATGYRYALQTVTLVNSCRCMFVGVSAISFEAIQLVIAMAAPLVIVAIAFARFRPAIRLIGTIVVLIVGIAGLAE